MTITLSPSGIVSKPKKASKAPSIGKTRAKAETRTFPRYVKGMSTLAYIQAYHSANASVMLTMPEYVNQQ
jgi:hypothetical protein